MQLRAYAPARPCACDCAHALASTQRGWTHPAQEDARHPHDGRVCDEFPSVVRPEVGGHLCAVSCPRHRVHVRRDWRPLERARLVPSPPHHGHHASEVLFAASLCARVTCVLLRRWRSSQPVAAGTKPSALRAAFEVPGGAMSSFLVRETMSSQSLSHDSRCTSASSPERRDELTAPRIEGLKPLHLTNEVLVCQCRALARRGTPLLIATVPLELFQRAMSVVHAAKTVALNARLDVLGEDGVQLLARVAAVGRNGVLPAAFRSLRLLPRGVALAFDCRCPPPMRNLLLRVR